ncbi:MAG: hypothetical protein RI580_18935 [Halothece sp. Uz-M2-17]|nr:hypothetical protein [Halothece sp. Uz-M2-17]
MKWDKIFPKARSRLPSHIILNPDVAKLPPFGHRAFSLTPTLNCRRELAKSDIALSGEFQSY